MNQIRDLAQQFIHNCDSGGGWEACAPLCHADATFSVEAPALAGIDTVESYADWAKGLLTPMPDAGYELRTLAVDEERQSAVGYAVFRGTHTGEGGPIPPTGQSVATDYVYVLQFDGDKIRHMRKIWNDGFALQQLGWA